MGLGNHQVGSRVGAMRNANDTTVWMYGFGIYEGDFVRPKGVPGVFGLLSDPEAEIAELIDGLRTDRQAKGEVFDEVKARAAAELIISNPRLKLDNGKTVWGCQCWWGPEDQIRQTIGARTIVYVDINEDVKAAIVPDAPEEKRP
jgi:hypothetical protein